MSHETRDTIFIGKKPLMTYVTTAIIQLATMPIITIKARGFSIGPAVDVAQIVLRKTGTSSSCCHGIDTDFSLNQWYQWDNLRLKGLNHSAGFFSSFFALPFLLLAPKLISTNKNPIPIRIPDSVL